MGGCWVGGSVERAFGRGCGTFSVSSVPDPLSTDTRLCWNAANPDSRSCGGPAGMWAASAIGTQISR